MAELINLVILSKCLLELVLKNDASCATNNVNHQQKE